MKGYNLRLQVERKALEMLHLSTKLKLRFFSLATTFLLEPKCTHQSKCDQSDEAQYPRAISDCLRYWASYRVYRYVRDYDRTGTIPDQRNANTPILTMKEK